jgi:hypothetical protein
MLAEVTPGRYRAVTPATALRLGGLVTAAWATFDEVPVIGADTALARSSE